MWTIVGWKSVGCNEIRYQCSYKYNLYCTNTTTETKWVYVVRGLIWTNVGGNAVGCNEIKWRRYPVMRAHLCGHTHPQVFSWNFLKKNSSLLMNRVCCVLSVYSTPTFVRIFALVEVVTTILVVIENWGWLWWPVEIVIKRMGLLHVVQ